MGFGFLLKDAFLLIIVTEIKESDELDLSYNSCWV